MSPLHLPGHWLKPQLCQQGGVRVTLISIPVSIQLNTSLALSLYQSYSSSDTHSLSIVLSVCLSFFSLSSSLSISVFLSLSLSLNVHLPLSFYLHVCLSLSVCACVFVLVHDYVGTFTFNQMWYFMRLSIVPSQHNGQTQIQCLLNYFGYFPTISIAKNILLHGLRTRVFTFEEQQLNNRVIKGFSKSKHTTYKKSIWHFLFQFHFIHSCSASI